MPNVKILMTNQIQNSNIKNGSACLPKPRRRQGFCYLKLIWHLDFGFLIFI